MTPKERAAMQQVICKIIQVTAFDETGDELLFEAQEILRKALAGDNMTPTEQSEQEPVGYFAYDEEHDIWEELTGPNAPGATPLYAAPGRTKDLTDDEIMDLVRDECVDMRWPSTPLFIARAVIQEYRRKNGIV